MMSSGRRAGKRIGPQTVPARVGDHDQNLLSRPRTSFQVRRSKLLGCHGIRRNWHGRGSFKFCNTETADEVVFSIVLKDSLIPAMPHGLIYAVQVVLRMA